MKRVVLITALCFGCSPSVTVYDVFDASTDATPDAPECPSPNPGPVPCEDAASCPVVPIGSCGEWKCPPKDSGQSFCEWHTNSGGP